MVNFSSNTRYFLQTRISPTHAKKRRIGPKIKEALTCQKWSLGIQSYVRTVRKIKSLRTKHLNVFFRNGFTALFTLFICHCIISTHNYALFIALCKVTNTRITRVSHCIISFRWQ